jgi:hypothetical protein
MAASSWSIPAWLNPAALAPSYCCGQESAAITLALNRHASRKEMVLNSEADDWAFGTVGIMMTIPDVWILFDIFLVRRVKHHISALR